MTVIVKYKNIFSNGQEVKKIYSALKELKLQSNGYNQYSDWYTAQAPPCCTKCNSPPINGQCTNFILFDVAL